MYEEIISWTSGHKYAIFIFVIITLGLICYSNVINSDFVWDDKAFVISNPAIKNLNTPISFFTNPKTVAYGRLSEDVYRPLMTLSFALDYRFFKLNSHFYHLENVIFHIFNAILLFFLLNNIFNNKTLSFLSSLIFLIHPVQTEAVSWISGRADVLFLFFYLSSFLFYVKYKKANKKLYLFYLSLALFVFALLSKEMAVTLPLVLLVYEFFFGEKDSFWKNIRRISIYFLILIFYIVGRYSIIGKITQKHYWGGSLYRTFLTVLKAVVYYLKILFVPVRLCANYVIFISKSILEVYVLLSLMIISAIIGVFIFAVKRSKIIAFGIAFFFITLLPVLNILPIKIIIAERFLYLPSIGFSIVVAAMLLWLRRYRVFFVLLTALLICGYTVRTYMRNFVWKDEYSLFSSIIETSPYSYKGHYNLANVYYNKNRYDAAIEEFKKAIKLKPDHFYSHLALGSLLHNKKRYDEALKEYEIALKIKPTTSTLNSLGVLSFDQNNYEKAIHYYKKAIVLDNNYVTTYINLGNAYYKLGEVDKAKTVWKKALQLNPTLKYIEENLAALNRRKDTRK